MNGTRHGASKVLEASKVLGLHPTIERHYSFLNPAQREAVAHTEGPLLIIAGPGSGKTLVLVIRALNILLQGKEDCDRHRRAIEYLQERGRITNREYRELCDVPDFTAHADLNDLIKRGLVISEGRGRSRRYRMAGNSQPYMFSVQGEISLVNDIFAPEFTDSSSRWFLIDARVTLG